jgi:hypothetical protein
MKRIFLILICGLLLGCSGSNYGANGTLKGRILRPGPNYSINGESIPPGPSNTDAFVYVQGLSVYKDRPLLAQLNPDNGDFSISINLGVESLGPPVVYNPSVSLDLYLKVNGVWWSDDTTSGTAKPFMTGVTVESGKETDIGTLVRVNTLWK